MTRFELTIFDKEVKFNVGLRFLGTYQQKNNCDINGMVEKLNNPWMAVPDFMYESALVANNGKLDFTKDELIDFIDDNGGTLNPQFSEFLNLFTESLVGGVPEEKGGSKKK
jgi:hypothetical protein